MPDSQVQQMQAAAALFGVVGLIVGLVAIIFSVIIYWRIFSKAGYSGAMGLWMFVPIANLVVILILAFGEWPIHRELNMLRQQVGGQQAFNPQGQQYPSGPNYPAGPNYPRQ